MSVKLPHIIYTGEKFIQERVQELQKDRFGATTFSISVLIIFLQILLIFINGARLPIDVPLFYNRVWGVRQLSTVPQLYLLPLFSFIFLLINFILTGLLIKEDKLLSKLVQGGAVVICVLAGFTLCRIIYLVI